MLTIQPQIKVGGAFQPCPVKQFRGGAWVDLYGGEPTGFTVRKTYQVSAGRESPVLDWVEIDVVDPVFCAACNGTTDLAGTLSDGTEIAATILGASETRVSCLVALPGRVCDPETLVEVNLYTGKTDGHTFAGVSLSTGANIANTDACGPTVTIAKTAAGLDPVSTDEWVHGQVLRVPDGSWLKDVGGGSTGTVTHICVSTPYPGGLDDYENPYLLYSEDDGATWEVWPYFDETTYFAPLVDWPGSTAFNSDVSMAIIDDELCVFYRTTSSQSSSATITTERTVVTGADLSTVAVGAAASVHGECLSPVVGYDGTSLYMFAVEGEGDIIEAPRREIARYESTDSGATWSNRTVVINDGGWPYKTWWHIGLSAEPIGGYWYMLASEVGYDGKPHTTGSTVRMFRSASLANWETVYEADAGLFTPQTGNGTELDNFYQGSLYPDSAGDAVANMYWLGSGYRWYRKTGALATPQAITVARYFGIGYSDLDLTERTALVLSDFESDGINNRGTGGDYVVSGSPTEEADGLSFDGVDDSISPQTEGVKLKLGGRGDLTLLADISLDATAGAQHNPIFVDTGSSSFGDQALRFQTIPSSGLALAKALFYKDAGTLSDMTGATNLEDGRHVLVAMQVANAVDDSGPTGNAVDYAFVDGARIGLATVDTSPLPVTAGGLTIGRADPAMGSIDHGRFKAHFLAIYEGDPRSRTYAFPAFPRVQVAGVAVAGSYEI